MKKYSYMMLLCFTASFAWAQVTGTVFVARKKISTDPVRGISVFMDGQFLCELDDNSFVEHRTDVGVHKFSASWAGSRQAVLDAVEINVTQSTEFYLRVTSREGADSLPILILDQVSGNAWPKLMTGLSEQDCE